MDLDKFFASDEEEEASGSEEEEADEESEAEPQTKPAKVVTTATSHPVSVARGGSATTRGHKAPQPTQETDDEYTDEESDEEDAFLRRG